MTKTVEFLFDFGSPTTYLAHKALPKVAARAKARIAHTPVLLGAIFKATGNASPATVPAKARYMADDLARFARRYGVSFAFNPHFPVNTMALMRGAVAYREDRRFLAYADAMFDAMWVEGRNLNDAAEIAAALKRADIAADDFSARIERDDVKAALRANTDDAVARGVFGAPTFFIDGAMFFGQDRLDFVEEALGA